MGSYVAQRRMLKTDVVVVVGGHKDAVACVFAFSITRLFCAVKLPRQWLCTAADGGN